MRLGSERGAKRVDQRQRGHPGRHPVVAIGIHAQEWPVWLHGVVVLAKQLDSQAGIDQGRDDLADPVLPLDRDVVDRRGGEIRVRPGLVVNARRLVEVGLADGQLASPNTLVKGWNSAR